MPDLSGDINPATLSQRPSVTLTTPILSNKSITVSVPSLGKFSKTQPIPTRIDLEPIYTALKSAIGSEQWPIYKEATTQFFIGMSPLFSPIHRPNRSPLLHCLYLTCVTRPPQPG